MAAQIRPRLAAMPRPPWQMIGAAGPPSAMVTRQIPPGGMTTSHDPSGTLALRVNLQTEGRNQVRSQMSEYEITFAGRAGTVLRAEFDDCDVTIGPDTTTLRAELPDPAALAGLMQRIAALRLEVVYVRLVASSPEQ